MSGNGTPIPTLVMRDAPAMSARRAVESFDGTDLLSALLATLNDDGTRSRAGLRSLMQWLIEEGKRYAQTPEGVRWARLLEASPAVTNGWFLWNHANIDFYLRNAEPLRESPAALLETVLKQLAHVDPAELLTQLSRVSAEADVARVRGATK